MQVEIWDISSLKKADMNVRRHNDKQISEYVRSIEMFGQIRPIVIDESGNIIAGNGLYEALLRMGRDKCDCYVMRGLSDAQKKKLMLADNKVYELGLTDVGAFDEIIRSLDGDIDVPGWDADLLKMMNASVVEADRMITDYGVFDSSDVGRINDVKREEHKPASTSPPTYTVAQQNDNNSGGVDNLPPPVAAHINAPSSLGQTETYAGAASTEVQPVGRFVICPKCGERICL